MTTMKKQESKFARATFDSSFKYLMLDEEVRLSFLRTFTGIEDIVEVSNYPIFVPPLKPGNMGTRRSTQRRMDFACRIRNGMIFIAEVQIEREDYWDARSLYYAAGVYSQQLEAGDPWHMLQNVVGIHILDHDSGTLTKPGDFEKHYVMTDRFHPDEEWPYIQIRQFEIPRIIFDLIPDGPKKQWLKIFKESMTMDRIPSDFDPIIQKALGYLDKKKWGGQLIEEYESEELRLEKYQIVLKEQRDEGINEGIKAVALKMLKRNKTFEEIMEYTGLSKEEISSLESE